MLAGVALAGVLFSRKVAKVIRVEAIKISEDESRYVVSGQLFFVSKIYFLQGFDIHDHPAKSEFAYELVERSNTTLVPNVCLTHIDGNSGWMIVK